MLKHVLLAGACLMGAAYAADTDTVPVLTGYKECSLPRPDGVERARVRVHITAEGKVASAELIETSGDAKYDKAAIDCMMQWTYKPATHNGQPVEFVAVREFGIHREDSPEDHKPFSSLKRDIDRRCHKLYPVKAYDLKPGHNISLVTVSRSAAGELRMEVSQSAGERADKQAVSCIKALIADSDHADLPASFVHTFEVRWEQRN